jgi:DNA-binding NarL/FixJ family response regulator
MRFVGDAPSSSGSQREPAARLRIAVADDHLPFRDAVASWLREVCGFEVVGISPADPAALAALAKRRADLLLLGANFPKVVDPDLVRYVKSNSIAPRVVVMSAHERRVAERATIEAGADGMVDKNQLVSELPGLLATIFGARAVSARLPRA